MSKNDPAGSLVSHHKVKGRPLQYISPSRKIFKAFDLRLLNLQVSLN